MFSWKYHKTFASRDASFAGWPKSWKDVGQHKQHIAVDWGSEQCQIIPGRFFSTFSLRVWLWIIVSWVVFSCLPPSPNLFIALWQYLADKQSTTEPGGVTVAGATDRHCAKLGVRWQGGEENLKLRQWHFFSNTLCNAWVVCKSYLFLLLLCITVAWKANWYHSPSYIILNCNNPLNLDDMFCP